MLHNLFAIKKLENGSSDSSSNNKMDEKASSEFIEDNFNFLKSQTGRNTFTFEEINNPLATIKLHKESLIKG
jgi:hypothetical protein